MFKRCLRYVTTHNELPPDFNGVAAKSQAAAAKDPAPKAPAKGSQQDKPGPAA